MRLPAALLALALLVLLQPHFAQATALIIPPQQIQHALPGQRHAWKARTPMPYARSDFTAVTVGDYIYIMGGCLVNQTWGVSDFGGQYSCGTDNSGVAKSTLRYDPTLNRFTAMADMPRKRMRHASASVGSKVYLMGGVDGFDTLQTTVDAYDTLTNTWSTPFSWPNATSDCAAFSLGNALFAMGGYDRPDYFAHAEVFRYTPGVSTAWTQVAPLNVGRGDLGAVSLNGMGYVMGGWTSADNYAKPIGVIEIYQPALDAWKAEEEPANYARADFAMGTFEDRVFLFGGENKDQFGVSMPINSVERYWAVDGGFWTTAGEQLTKRYRHVAASYGTSVFVFGGQGYRVGVVGCGRSGEAGQN
jgi:hypothetical protein